MLDRTWRALAFSHERGRAFAAACQQPGACRCCAGRRWWTEAGAVSGWRCTCCHPADHLQPDQVRFTDGFTGQPGQ